MMLSLDKIDTKNRKGLRRNSDLTVSDSVFIFLTNSAF